MKKKLKNEIFNLENMVNDLYLCLRRIELSVPF